jgi:hypothetical protein
VKLATVFGDYASWDGSGQIADSIELVLQAAGPPVCF